MKKFFLLVACFFILISCFNARGQYSVNFVEDIIDSLDQIQPAHFKNLQPKGKPYVIKINNQKQFDRINDELTKAITEGKKNIRVKIKRGEYHFHENHIIRKDENSDVSIVIEGKQALLTSDVKYTEEPESPWQELKYADSLLEVVDESKKLCFIPWTNSIGENEKNNYTKVQVLQWYKSIVYDVVNIDEKGIFFVAPEITYIKKFGREGYSVNLDYLYGRTIPRFRLFDATKERECLATCFVKLQNSSYKYFILKGLQINGNKEGASLISLKDVSAERITVTDCKFSNIRSSVVKCIKTSNVEVDKNVIRKTDGDELYFSGGCSNIIVTKNYFKDNGLCLTNKRCVTCIEAEYYVAYNTFVDFGRTAIGVGVWHGAEKKHSSKGIIEHNEIYYTSQYFTEYRKHTLMDSGALYVWTQNDEVIIRYNYIHDYIGAKDNRGIFCDDGASNLWEYLNKYS